MLLTQNSTLLMIGDSVTDCGRTRPVAEARGDNLGTGYVALTDALLHTLHPARNIRVINMGVSGNTVRDLAARWDSDALALKPDLISVMIGINDVWRQFDGPLIPEAAVLEDDYAAIYERLIQKTLAQNIRMILLTPYYIEPLRQDAMRAKMDAYGGIVRNLAEKYSLPCLDTQAVFDEALHTRHSCFFAWDRVHPRLPGHMALAVALLKALGAM